MILIDATNISYADWGSRDFVAQIYGENNNLIMKAGVITKTYVGKTLANFFIKFNKPLFPFKLFKTKEEAIEWLKKK